MITKCLEFSEKELIEATQAAQDAQAGNTCDYCNKRQPLSFNECRECVKGLKQLSARYKDDPLNKLGKRYAMRIMRDAYGKCCVRAAVENTNLRAYAKKEAMMLRLPNLYKLVKQYHFLGRTMLMWLNV